MNLASFKGEWSPRVPRCAAALCLALGAGCERHEIRVYTAPKEKPAQSQAMTVRPRPVSRPRLEWIMPAGWHETGPGQMAVATFAIAGEGGKSAQVAITPLPNMAGRETMVVNMMRASVGLPELGEEEMKKQFESVEVGGEKASLFELIGTAEGSQPMRIVTAMAHRGDTSWFYKLSGDTALVGEQKPAFITFLKSIQMKPASDDATAAPAVPEGAAKFKWQVPGQWRELSPGEMQVARFALPERGAAKAEVFVSVFPSDTGGKLANINRWRGQLGLAQVGGDEMASLVKPLDPANPDALLVDLTNNDRRLVGAIVPREGRFWFYKMIGDGGAVSSEKDAFVAFVKSTP